MVHRGIFAEGKLDHYDIGWTYVVTSQTLWNFQLFHSPFPLILLKMLQWTDNVLCEPVPNILQQWKPGKNSGKKWRPMPYTKQALAVYYKQTSVEERERVVVIAEECVNKILWCNESLSHISITWCTGSFNVQHTPSWLFENLAFPPLRCQESSEVANENTLNLCRTFDDPRRTVNPRALPKQ